VRLFLEHGEGSSRQPPPKTRENSSVLRLLIKLCSVSSLIIHKPATDYALSEFPKTPRSLSSIAKLPSLFTPRVNLSDKLDKDGKLSGNEHKYCINNNLCLYYGSKDHKVDRCPKK